jgi:hypothetical protein
MVLESVSTTIEGVKTNVSDSDHHARVKKIRKIVRNAGSITQNELTRLTQEMTPNQRRDALADLAAEIESKDGRGSGPGRPPQSYGWKG